VGPKPPKNKDFGAGAERKGGSATLLGTLRVEKLAKYFHFSRHPLTFGPSVVQSILQAGWELGACPPVSKMVSVVYLPPLNYTSRSSSTIRIQILECDF